MKRAISVIICGLVILSSLVFATGCGRSSHDVDLSKYVKFDGFSTVASLESTPDYEKCEDERDKIAEKRSDIKDKSDSKYKEYTEKISELTDVKNALKNITFSLSKGDDGKIKNGDTITVKAKYKADKIKNFGVNIKADEFTVKVSGLEDKKIIDPFDEDHFELKASGLNGDGRVENGKDNDDIYYSFDPSSDLKNGDKVTVEASMYDDDAVLKDGTDDGTKATKEITVSGFGNIPKTLDGVDTSHIDDVLLEKLTNDTDVDEGETLKGYDLNISDSDYMFAKLKVVSLGDYNKINGIYGYKKEGDGDESCKYGVAYSRDITVKVVDSGYSSKVKKGTTKKFTVYLGAYVSGGYLMVNDDNELVKATSYSMIVSSTSGDSYKKVKKNMTYDTDYKYSEVK